MRGENQGLLDRIAQLEKRLDEAMSSGDEATNNLRKQLADLEKEFDAFKIKSKQDYESTVEQMTTAHKRELDAMRDKYE